MCTNYEFALHAIMEKFRDTSKPVTVKSAIDAIGNRQLMVYRAYLDGESVRTVVNNLISNGYLYERGRTEDEDAYSLSELGISRFKRYEERVNKEAAVV